MEALSGWAALVIPVFHISEAVLESALDVSTAD
jgi:hypothetical protein